METKLNELTINGIAYIPKGSANTKAEPLDGMSYVICRTYSAGVFAGYLKSRNGQEVVMINARRIWYWSGAASLSELALSGTKQPSKCKFPAPVETIELLQAVEILYCTEAAKKSIEGVPIWTA